MKTQTLDALSYCYDVCTFIFGNKDAERIQSIYLFGSAVRGELTKKSDIDVFIDCSKADENDVKRIVDSGIVKFQSSLDYKKWKLLKFTYPFSIKVGRIKEWDLKLSIASEGLLLFSRHTNLQEGNRMVLFSIEYPAEKKRYIQVRRILFGRDESQFQEGGAVRPARGQKISSHVFLIPKEEQSQMIELLSKEKVEFSMKEVNLLGS